MKTLAIIEGLTILQKYRDVKESSNCGAEHDVIYAYETDHPLNPEDLSRMIALGWFQEAVDFGEGGYSDEHYDIEESWCCYV